MQEKFKSQQDTLKIIDFCSGTGCISLLLYSLLTKVYPKVEVLGLDISNKALRLSNQNVRFNALKNSAQHSVRFELADVLGDQQKILDKCRDVDVMISNPPYISEDGFNKETTRSVRNWEPRLALVPDPSKLDIIYSDGNSRKVSPVKAEDAFYYRLLQFHSILKPKILVMEVGDEAQAKRVVQMATRSTDKIEIWRDWPDLYESENGREEYMLIDDLKVVVKGTGLVRAVILLSNQYFGL